MPPASLRLAGVELTLWSYPQLERLDRVNRKKRALDLHQAAGPELSPQLKAGLPPAELTLWIIDLQVAVCGAAGIEVSAEDFGVPNDAVLLEGWQRPATFEPWDPFGCTSQQMFTHDSTYSQAAADSSRAAVASKQQHNGTLGTFLFGSTDAHEPAGPVYQGLMPPYQIAPPGSSRPHTETGKRSISMSSYVPPPSAAYRQ